MIYSVSPPGHDAGGRFPTGPQLRLLQGEYDAWRERLPESLTESRTAELLAGVCDLDVDALDVELPRGFGRD